MGITYAPLLALMKQRNMMKNDLRGGTLKLSSATVAKIEKGEPVSLKVIDRICQELGVQIQDVVQYKEGPFLKATSRKKKK